MAAQLGHLGRNTATLLPGCSSLVVKVVKLISGVVTADTQMPSTCSYGSWAF